MVTSRADSQAGQNSLFPEVVPIAEFWKLETSFSDCQRELAEEKLKNTVLARTVRFLLALMFLLLCFLVPPVAKPVDAVGIAQDDVGQGPWRITA